MSEPVTFRLGVPQAQIARATRIYCEAFGEKLSPFLGSVDDMVGPLSSALVADRAVVAMRGGEVAGVVGFKVRGRGLFEPTFWQFAKAYGWSGPFRLLGLSFLDRPERSGELLLDGLAVAADARGQGLGTGLLKATEAHAARLGKVSVGLDVVDTNPRARQLYERVGFAATKTTGVGAMRLVFPFRAVTRMTKPVDVQAAASLHGAITPL
ncbi:MAG: GNAT family N-acetyltransferase [Pseudomonadota bacterium]